MGSVIGSAVFFLESRCLLLKSRRGLTKFWLAIVASVYITGADMVLVADSRDVDICIYMTFNSGDDSR